MLSDEYGNKSNTGKALANLDQLFQKGLIQRRIFSSKKCNGKIYGFYPNTWDACKNMTDDDWDEIEKDPKKVLEGGT